MQLEYMSYKNGLTISSNCTFQVQQQHFERWCCSSQTALQQFKLLPGFSAAFPDAPKIFTHILCCSKAYHLCCRLLCYLSADLLYYCRFVARAPRWVYSLWLHCIQLWEVPTLSLWSNNFQILTEAPSDKNWFLWCASIWNVVCHTPVTSGVVGAIVECPWSLHAISLESILGPWICLWWIVIATGLGNPPAVRICTGSSVLFGSITVQKPDQLPLGGPSLYLCQSTYWFWRVWLDLSVPISGSSIWVVLFMVAFRYPILQWKSLTLVRHCLCFLCWVRLQSKRADICSLLYAEVECQRSVHNFSLCIKSNIWRTGQPYWNLWHLLCPKSISLHLLLHWTHLVSWWRYLILAAQNGKWCKVLLYQKVVILD